MAPQLPGQPGGELSKPFQPILVPKHMGLPWPKEWTPSGFVSLISGTPTFVFKSISCYTQPQPYLGSRAGPLHVLSTSNSPGGAEQSRDAGLGSRVISAFSICITNVAGRFCFPGDFCW